MIQSYGNGSSTYEAAGGLSGIRQLVDDFYNIMDNTKDYHPLRKMHASDLETSKNKLTCFLSGWMGGEALYALKYGSINIPQTHAFIKIDYQERDMWMSCMTQALKKQNYPDSLVHYLIEQLSIPAERIRLASEAYHR